VLLAPPSFDNPRSHLSRVQDRVALDYLIPIGLVRSLGATIGGAQERVHIDKGLTLMPLIPGPPTGYLPSTSGASLSLSMTSHGVRRERGKWLGFPEILRHLYFVSRSENASRSSEMDE
jgi:hypothetical protein